MAPSYALVRRLGGEEKMTVRVEDLFILNNYDLSKFAPKNSRSVSANNLYGFKKVDERGVTKIIKCKIILLKGERTLISIKLFTVSFREWHLAVLIAPLVIRKSSTAQSVL